MYNAIRCSKCGRYFMSTSTRNFKCHYCGSLKGNVMESREDSRVITEYIKQSNIPKEFRSDF